jgi:hypothetical protein
MKETRAFHEMVDERGRELRRLDYQDLAGMETLPPACVKVGRRNGKIACLYQLETEGRVAVVIRGDLNTWLPCVKRVFRHGFFKYPDGRVADIPLDSLYDYDPLIPE